MWTPVVLPEMTLLPLRWASVPAPKNAVTRTPPEFPPARFLLPPPAGPAAALDGISEPVAGSLAGVHVPFKVAGHARAEVKHADATDLAEHRIGDVEIAARRREVGDGDPRVIRA